MGSISQQDKRTILIVDDNFNNIDIVVQHLQAYSFRILTASDGLDGLARAELAHPDLILLDIRMPGIDGLETCRRLKANPSTADIPVIFMSAMADIDHKVRGFEVGAIDYVTKPIEEAELVARVQIHMNLRDLQQRLETRVEERTAALQTEIASHEKAQEERELLLDLLREQSTQLQEMTHQSLATQGQTQMAYTQMTEQMTGQIHLLATVLQQVADILGNVATVEDPITAAQHRLEEAQVIVTELQQQAQTDDGTEQADEVLSVESPLLKLSTREYEVFQLLAEGKSNQEMGDILAITPATVSTYRYRIMRKLGLPDTSTLMKVAVESRGRLG